MIQGDGGPEDDVEKSVESVEEMLPASPHQLSPRHRRLTQLLAQGLSNAQIKEELGYSDSRVSILKRSPAIAHEVRRLQDKLFEETIQKRLKDFAEPALSNIHMILTDQTNRVKIHEKADMSKWVVEKLDGKAVQKVEAGENLLAALMDRLDSSPRVSRAVTPLFPFPAETHSPGEAIEVQAEPPKPKTEEELLSDWAIDFVQQSK